MAVQDGGGALLKNQLILASGVDVREHMRGRSSIWQRRSSAVHFALLTVRAIIGSRRWQDLPRGPADLEILAPAPHCPTASDQQVTGARAEAAHE